MNTVRTRAARRPAFARAAIVALFALALCSPAAAAQGSPEYQADRMRAFVLFDANNFVDALPLLEKLYAANQSDVVVLERLGFVLTGRLSTIKDPAERAKVRARARAILLRARELGDNSNLLQGALDALDAPDVGGVSFSNQREVEASMREGEEAFSRGDMDKAIDAYRHALELDPRLYQAALFVGDSYFKKGYAASDAAEKQKFMEQAGEWFARAVSINPDMEAAHRYWGDALLAQGKRAEARDKFIDAVVASPGERGAYVGLTQWADKYGVKLAHPEIEVPTSVTPLQGGKMTINLDPKAFGDGKSDDGGAAWVMYGLTRASWATDKFAKEFPQEKAYRHTLREEAEALHSVAESARQQAKDGKAKKLSNSLDNLVKLDEAGLLEPYIFFARADRGIVQDYAAYRKANRDKLRRYWAEFVVRGK
jgi:tetratricopeptide (TPR) repeat protein